ncbi:type II toxin-antitoxin system RelE/ParE family toxin [Sinorhizobium terangae]|uniref:type II toxin-antitoxin system RelE/ParE family toxin n=1 Tax=Sinorhizobium terangae TaxID=110322 RepID=UPI0024B282D4|nr:type II toxin-antitoxin system RelE/ParE family toxin [Sinorhizobium terangae]WFU49167.1 type II toxin-antitoxin system RelE/ParE family toxin [Sinorhizobium terangae]
MILDQKGHRAFFVYGFPKSARANIEKDEEQTFKKMAKHVLGLSDAQLEELVEARKFKEVKKHDEEKVQKRGFCLHPRDHGGSS